MSNETIRQSTDSQVLEGSGSMPVSPPQSDNPFAEPAPTTDRSDLTESNGRLADLFPIIGQSDSTETNDPLLELSSLIGQPEWVETDYDPATVAALAGPPDIASRVGHIRFGRGERAATSPPSVPYDWRKDAAAMPPYETAKQPSINPAGRIGSSGGELVNPAEAQSNEGLEPDFGLPSPSENHAAVARAVRDPQECQVSHPEEERQRVGDLSDSTTPESSEDVPYFINGPKLTSRDEQSYDDVPRAHRRKGFFGAVMLFACAIVGTSGAYGYRNYFAGTSSLMVPTMVSFGGTPSKTLSSSDTQISKSFQDRIGGLSPAEPIMPGSEQPAELASGGSVPRVVLAPPVAPLTNRASPPVQRGRVGVSTSPGSGSVTPGAEPKAIRTIPIRPVGGDGSRQSSRSATWDSGSAHSVGGTGGGVSLDPEIPANMALLAPSALLSERSVAAMPLTPTAPRAGSPLAPQPAMGGSYLVQLSSHRSETEAHSSFRAMQTKYPAQLSGRVPLVVRAALGAKGTFYRAMVGPFASLSDAGNFCGNFKAAGGQCLIQRTPLHSAKPAKRLAGG